MTASIHLAAPVAGLAAGLAVLLLLAPRPSPPLRQPPGPPGARTDSRDAGRRPEAGLRGLRGVLAVGGGLGVGLLVGGWVGVLVGAAVAGVVWAVLGRAEPVSERRRREELERALPHAVDLLAAALAVGAAPSSALRLVADAVDPPLGEELRQVRDRLRWGTDPVCVWNELGHHPQLGPLGRTLARAAETGAPVSAAMHQLAEDLREEARLAVEARARSVGVSAALPLGGCLLPAFVLVGVVPLVAGSLGVLLGP